MLLDGTDTAIEWHRFNQWQIADILKTQFATIKDAAPGNQLAVARKAMNSTNAAIENLLFDDQLKNDEQIYFGDKHPMSDRLKILPGRSLLLSDFKKRKSIWSADG